MLGISIIIPCYNTGVFLKEAINSILEQPIIHDYEIILVDDASNDYETLQIIKELQKRKNIKIITNTSNKGVQHSRNKGLLGAKYDYIMMLDSDDKLNIDSKVLANGTYLDLGITRLISNQDIAFIHCISEMFDLFCGYTISSYPLTEELVIKKHHVPTSIIYRKIDAISSGMYDEKILKWQDWSFGVNLLNYRKKNGKKNQIAFLDESFHKYRIHMKTSRVSQRKVDEYQMIKDTVLKNSEIFLDYFPGLSIEVISNYIFNNKPNRFDELLYVAKNNIDIAKAIIIQRKYHLETNIDTYDVP